MEDIQIEIAENVIESEKQVYQEMIYQLGFDLFSFMSARVSSELSGDTIDSISKFLEPILTNFNE